MKTLLDDGARSKDQAHTKAGEKLSGETLAIRGGRPLSGRVEVKGAKNLATKAMVAALLGETTSVLRDVPDILRQAQALLECAFIQCFAGQQGMGEGQDFSA